MGVDVGQATRTWAVDAHFLLLYHMVCRKVRVSFVLVGVAEDELHHRDFDPRGVDDGILADLHPPLWFAHCTQRRHYLAVVVGRVAPKPVSVGDAVEVFSHSSKAWVQAEVTDVAAEDVDAERGLTKGSVRVRYTSGVGIKWVSPRHVPRDLRLVL